MWLLFAFKHWPCGCVCLKTLRLFFIFWLLCVHQLPQTRRLSINVPQEHRSGLGPTTSSEGCTTLPPNGRSTEGSPCMSEIKCPFIVYRDKQLRKLSYIGNQWSRIAAQSSINQSTCTHAYTHIAIVGISPVPYPQYRSSKQFTS